MDHQWGRGGRPSRPPLATPLSCKSLQVNNHYRQSVTSRVARFLAAKYGRLLSIRDVRQGQYLRLLLYYALTRSLQLSTFYNTVVCIFIIM